MPTLTAIDTSVTDSRITLTFSHRPPAHLYAKHLESLDRRSPSRSSPSSSFSGSGTPTGAYRRSPRYNPTTKEVSVALPPFITWFITCRLPDDEDSITFTFDDADEADAMRWAEGMVVFERVDTAPGSGNGNSNGGGGYGHPHGNPHGHGEEGLKQLHVRRLWNAERLQKRLEGLRTSSQSSSSPARSSSGRRGPTPGPQGPRVQQGQQQTGSPGQYLPSHGVARVNSGGGQGLPNGNVTSANAIGNANARAGWWS